MSTLQNGFLARLLTLGLLLIALVAGTFAAPLSADQELAPPGAPSPRHEPMINTKRNALGESQWVYMTIRNEASSGDMYIRNTKLHWGKWYDYPDKDHELSDNDVQGGRAGPNGGTMVVAASGRAWTPSGTEGQFDIYHGGIKVCHVYFDCPFSHIHNSFSISDINGAYAVQETGASLGSGPLGTITIEVVKMNDWKGQNRGQYGGYGW
ncbi:Aegerolysin-domain-containing protein [Copromyces sp. CBS 386.78]|nr:Aegerolysin-domain-containing protein [Copromyces sp. CBS 386.78]